MLQGRLELGLSVASLSGILCIRGGWLPLLLSLFLLPIFSSFMTIIGDCQLWGSWECTESPNSLCKPSGLSRSNWASHRCICCFSQHKSPTEGWLLRVLFHLDNVCWLPISLLVRVPGTGKYNGESSSLEAYMLVEATINQAPMCVYVYAHAYTQTYTYPKLFNKLYEWYECKVQCALKTNDTCLNSVKPHDSYLSSVL